MYKTFVIFITCISSIVQSQTSYKDAINDFVNDKDMFNASISICMMNTSNGKIVAQYNPNLSLIPASSMKVITTIAGIGILNMNYKFRTELQYDGFISNGVLNGNLFIKGYGDPTLGSEDFPGTMGMNPLLDSIVAIVKRKGITKITGKIYGDGTLYESGGVNEKWQLDDICTDYGAGAWGLNLRENYYYLNFLQSSLSGVRIPVTSIIPEVPDLQFVNQVRTGYPTDIAVVGSPYNNIRLLKGRIPPGNKSYSLPTSIPDPITFAAYHIKKRLTNSGIEVLGEYKNIEFESSIVNVVRTNLWTFYSPELCDIVSRTNYESVNLYAESILKTIGYTQTGYGTSKFGINGIMNYLRIKGLDTNGLYMDDGSGLSPRNGVSAYHLAGVLRLAKQDEAVFTDIYNSLPEAGVNGTLKNFMKGYKNSSVIKAKSGTLTRVKSYTGYINTGKNIYSFSVIVNNFNCTQAQLKPKLERLLFALSK
jgi:serine-type D-Ala-D-Ala carboxypeptidase/endopeptidase (penicillin-binding protein 4)